MSDIFSMRRILLADYKEKTFIFLVFVHFFFTNFVPGILNKPN